MPVSVPTLKHMVFLFKKPTGLKHAGAFPSKTNGLLALPGLSYAKAYVPYLQTCHAQYSAWTGPAIAMQLCETSFLIIVRLLVLFEKELKTL